MPAGEPDFCDGKFALTLYIAVTPSNFGNRAGVETDAEDFAAAKLKIGKSDRNFALSAQKIQNSSQHFAFSMPKIPNSVQHFAFSAQKMPNSAERC